MNLSEYPKKRGRGSGAAIPITINGVHYESKCAACEANNISYMGALHRVLNEGMSWEEAISRGEFGSNSIEVFGDKYRSVTEFCQITGLCIPTAMKYIRKIEKPEDKSKILEFYYKYTVEHSISRTELRSNIDAIRSKYNLPTLWPYKGN